MDSRHRPPSNSTTAPPEAEGADAFLLSWSDAVRFIAEPQAILWETVARLGRRLRATRVNYAEADATGEALTVERDWTDGVASVAGGVFPLAELGEAVIADHLRGRPFTTADFHADPRAGPGQRALYHSVGVRAAISAPLVKDGRLLAVLSVQQARPREWTGAEVRLVQELAERTWAVLERARAEAELARSRERRHQGEKSAALDQLLSGIGHELNNPLAIIAAQAALLQRTPASAETTRRAVMIAEAASRCARTVQTFLTIARRNTAVPEPVGLNAGAAVSAEGAADDASSSPAAGSLEPSSGEAGPWRTAWLSGVAPSGVAPDLVELLKAERFTCTCAPDLTASHDPPELVVGVLTGSGRDGAALMEKLASGRPELLDRLMFLVDDDAGAAAIRFLQRARRPFLQRPFSAEELREVLREAGIGPARTGGAGAL